MYCMHCGEKIDENLLICPHCGTAQNQVTKKDYGGFGYGVLGFFFPFIGLILFLVLRESKPNTAKAAGIGALAGEITKALLFILLIVIQVTSVRMSMMP